MEEQATITVERTSPDDVGFREIFVSVDGEEIAILRNRESVTRQMTPGPHEMRAHNTLFRKRLQFDLKPGEHATFLGVNKAGRGTYSIAAVLGAGPVYLVLERVTDRPTGTSSIL